MAVPITRTAFVLIVSSCILPCNFISELSKDSHQQREENINHDVRKTYEEFASKEDTVFVTQEEDIFVPGDIDDEESTVTNEDLNDFTEDVNELEGNETTVTYLPPAITGQGVDEISPGLQLSVVPITNNSTLSLSEHAILNITDRAARKIVCLKKNKTGNTSETVRVQEVNSTELLLKLNPKNETSGNCAVVMFYAPWCMFCAKTAPHYNALARAFPEIDVLAIDAIHFNTLNARFGTIAVPNILVFHNSKAVARFNSSTRTLETLMDFVANVTGLEPNRSTEVTVEDFQGPLASVPQKEVDYLLLLSWIFVVVFVAVALSRSHVGKNVWNFLTSFGQEHRHHID